MNKLYSERNGMREPLKKTTIIDADSYSVLWNCCERYKINLAWKYPDYCLDFPQVICGVKEELLDRILKKTIPDLIYGFPTGYLYMTKENPFDASDVEEEIIEDNRNYYSILDYVEFVAQEMKTIKQRELHPWYSHHHLSFAEDDSDFKTFRKEINGLFEMCGLLYHLSEKRIVERVVEDGFVVEESKAIIDNVSEKGLKKLLEESVELHKSRKPADHQLATKVLWGAFERMKTLYAQKQDDKSTSSDSIIELIANGNANFAELFKNEFEELRKIGNNYRIRHEETYKIDIPNNDYYDYFFGRCFSLIVLALKSIK